MKSLIISHKIIISQGFINIIIMFVFKMVAYTPLCVNCPYTSFRPKRYSFF